MTAKSIVLVTGPQYDKGAACFSRQDDICFQRVPDDEEGLAAAVTGAGARAVVVGTKRYQAGLYQALHSVGSAPALIARFGVGHDGIDKAECRQRNILVTNTPGVLSDAVAELTLVLMGALARQIVLMSLEMKSGKYQPRTGLQLQGRRLAVIGFGAIGRCVARGAHGGFGLRVTVAGTRPAAEVERQEGIPMAELLARFGAESYTTEVDALLASADVVSLHLPPLPDKQALLNRDRLASLKKEALLINTARGSLVDEEALFEALSEGRLAGAALDVSAQEPYVPAAPGKDLRTLPNVICTPHVGSNTGETNFRIADGCVRNVRSFLAGRLGEMNRVG
jgi:phosphoglycerate dehydrogenase-like enzyme